ncbi:P-type conjugative transfer protein TrbJ [Sphingomonas sp. UNC305MFCol5.2]|uniref:P-type conjugative transfer protein TrbJ n=1 Tax=Sphingomonas sp. UNC305MFCol5.2 TaxID=1449076 RepID=UPI0004A76B83|nr:P-type conjugative transfer protein TrbJ [Sphingomonas sp. UNC305MFCol5.2]
MSRSFAPLLLRAAFPVGIAALGIPSLAAAQITVFDPTNYSQNLLTAARTLQQINNQIQSLQNEAAMLRNMERNLARTDFPDLAGLVSRMKAVGALIQQAQGIAFRTGQVDQQFRQLFPDFDARVGASAVAAQAKARLDTAMAGFRQTMKVQADVAENIEADAATLARLSEKSQNAVGGLQVAQATNQLLALAAKQQFQIQQLLAAQFRAEATDSARRAQAELDAHAATRKFLGSGTAYSPR